MDGETDNTVYGRVVSYKLMKSCVSIYLFAAAAAALSNLIRVQLPALIV